MPQRDPSPARNQNVYLLFAHAPYYLGPGTQEINTTAVPAGSLLHPQVCQPDGARIHDLLIRGRQSGEIVPLSTLTHELGGGADWPAVGDWESVTTDLVQLRPRRKLRRPQPRPARDRASSRLHRSGQPRARL